MSERHFQFLCRFVTWRMCIVWLVLIAGSLRFIGITDVGIRFDDEGAYALDARHWHRCAKLAVDPEAVRAVIRGDKAAVKERIAALGIDFESRYEKPSYGYTFLAAATMFVIGDDPSALNFLNALCGTVTVLLVLLVGTRWFGRGIGFVAALLLAVSPYHLGYSRDGLAESTTLLFLVLAVWFWPGASVTELRRGRRYLYSGMALGYAFTCHYRSASVAVGLLIADLIVRLFSTDSAHSLNAVEPSARASGVAVESSCGSDGAGGPVPIRSTGRRLAVEWAALAFGYLLPLLPLEAVLQTAGAVARSCGGEAPFPTFFEALWERMATESNIRVRPVDGSIVNWSVPSGFAWFLEVQHGWPAVALALIGVVSILRCRTTAIATVVIPSVLVLLLGLQRHVFARVFSPALPFFCIAAAVGARAVVKWGRRIRLRESIVIPALAALLILCIVPETIRVRSQHSDIRSACAYVNEKGGAVALPLGSTNRNKYCLYLDPARTRAISSRWYRLGSPREVVAQLRREGVDRVIIDPESWQYRDLERRPDDHVFMWYVEFARILDDECTLERTFPHITGAEWDFLSEGYAEPFVGQMVARGDGPIRIYSLAKNADNGAQSRRNKQNDGLRQIAGQTLACDSAAAPKTESTTVRRISP